MGSPPSYALKWYRYLRAHPYSVITILFAAATVVPFAIKKKSDWALSYMPAAKRLTLGEEIFQNPFVYPPVNAWLLAPLTYVPDVASRLVWFLLSMVALVVMVRGAWRLSGGGRLEGDPMPPRQAHAMFGIGMLCGLAYILDTFANQQTDLIIGALVIVGCGAQTSGRSLWAGLLFGIAAGIKCTPLLWAPYLLWRRQWAAAVLVPVVAVSINLLPELTHPSPGPTTRAEQWAMTFLTPMSEEKHDIGVWAAGINFNHSIIGVVNRLLVWERSWIAGDEVLAPRMDRASPTRLKIVAGAFVLSLLFLTLVSSWRARWRNPDRGWTDAPSIESIEFSLVLLLMVLLSPHSSKPHFCTLVLPGFCLARAAYVTKDRALWVFVIGAVVCGLVANRDLVGKPIYSWLKWYGAITWGAVLLHLGCCWALIRGRVAPYASPKNSEAPTGAKP